MEISETTIIEELKILKESSERLIGLNEKYLTEGGHGSKLGHYELCHQVDEIIKEYNWIVPKINKLMASIEIDSNITLIEIINKNWKELKENHTYSILDSHLREISLKSGRIISILRNLATKTQETKNKFEGIKKEIDEIKKDIQKNVFENLLEALKEFESNHLLSATLICGRIIIYNLDSISHQIEEVIKKFKEKGLLNIKGSNEQILKANKKARGLFAHDLNYMPTPSETLSIFGDTINIVKKITEYQKQNEQLSKANCE